MANSTFSGPVRSQNGFQELVDGVWTPLGGGGGGGSVVVLPADTTTYVLPLGTLGQVITIVMQNDTAVFPVTLNLSAETVPNGVTLFTGFIVVPGMGPEIQPVDYSGVLEINTSTPYQFTFIYRGLNVNGPDPTATWAISGYGSIMNI